MPTPKRFMRILYVGYGFHPCISGGAAQIQWEIIKCSQKLGYKPIIFQAGLYSLKRGVRLEQKTLDDEIQLFNMMNSPNRPGNRNPKSEVSHEVILKISREVLQTVKPSIVHVHELTFHCAAFIDECRKMGIPIVKTIHNYWDVCPQRDLMYNREILCTDYNEGLRCVDCRPVGAHRIQAAAFWNLFYGKPYFRVAQDVWNGWQRIESVARNHFRPMRSINANLDDSSRHILAADYASRRSSFVQRLNSLDRIHVYSRRSMQILVSYGVAENKIQHIPVATAAIDNILPRDLHNGELPIRFGYRGGIGPNKGIHILIESFKRLDQSKAKLIIYGTGHSEYISYLNKLATNANVEFCGRYKTEDLSVINSTIDVGIIPSIWEELFGLVGVEYIQSRVPIIASNIGAMPEYVHHGKNGFLFTPGDITSLEQTMQSIIDRPSIVHEMQMHMLRWNSVNDLTQNIGDLYRDVIETQLSGK